MPRPSESQMADSGFKVFGGRTYFVSKSGEERGNLNGVTAPAINKVVQSAGRLIRSEKDRGVVVLIDERFAQARYATLLPPEMRPKMLGSREELAGELKMFFDKKMGAAVGI